MSARMLSSLGPVIFTLLLGWFAGFRKLIEQRTFSAINTMLMNFALPASLFLAMARTPKNLLRQDVTAVSVLALGMLTIYGIVWVLERRLFHSDANGSAVQSLTVAFPNCAAVGLPLLATVFGPQGTSIAALGIAVGAIVISPLTIGLLERSARNDSAGVYGFVRNFARAFGRPVVWAPMAGIAFAAAGFTVNDVCARSLSLLGQGAAGIALFLTGLILSAQRFSFTPSMLAGVALKNVAQPALVYGLGHALGLANPMLAEITLLTAVPAGFFGTVFAARFGVASLEASSTLVISTLVSVISLACAMLLLGV